jgi:hypothetical protein
VVGILYELAKKNNSYKESYADHIGVAFQPLEIISPPVKGVRPEIHQYNPDMWAKLKNNTIDVYEVWDSQSEFSRQADCVQDILLPALTQNIATLSIVCFDQDAADFARRLGRIILPSIHDEHGKMKLDPSEMLPYVIAIPEEIQTSRTQMKAFLSKKLYLPSGGGKQGETTKAKSLQLEFWQEFVDYVKTSSAGLELRKPRPQHWFNVAIGSSKAHIALTADTQKNLLGCQIYIPREKRLFRRLRKKRSEIERKVGEKLDWQPLPHKRASRIIITSEADITEKSRWARYFKWLLQTTMNFKDAFQEPLREATRSLK